MSAHARSSAARTALGGQEWLSPLDEAIIAYVVETPGQRNEDQLYQLCSRLCDSKTAFVRNLERLVTLGHVKSIDSARVAPRQRRYAPADWQGGTVTPLSGARAASAAPPPPSAPAPTPRAFTAADKALIRKVHGHVLPSVLLGILNDRLVADLGGAAAHYTMEQLHAEIADADASVPAGGSDWASLRKLLAQAKQDGILASLTEQMIDDFAVVFSLNPKQVLTLKDVLLDNGEESE